MPCNAITKLSVRKGGIFKWACDPPTDVMVAGCVVVVADAA